MKPFIRFGGYLGFITLDAYPSTITDTLQSTAETAPVVRTGARLIVPVEHANPLIEAAYRIHNEARGTENPVPLLFP